MRLLKAQNTNLRTINGRGVQFDVNDQVFMESTNVMRIPKGTTAQRPTTPENGHIRYNTTDEVFELYENGAWRNVRSAEPFRPGITQQNLGTGDAVEKIFGPLASGDALFPVPAAAQNVLVFVENVFQISTTNYTLVQNPAKTNTIASIISVGATTVVQTSTNHGYAATDLVQILELNAAGDAVENLNNGDSSSPTSHSIVSIPAANRIEVAVDTTGGNALNYPAAPNNALATIRRASSIDGQAYADGYYLEFTSAPDLGKPITVIHNFDK
tara:strand:- start:199 stop:1011 length:813 start_codon:yes stop_codon:yes gene_type:complete